MSKEEKCLEVSSGEFWEEDRYVEEKNKTKGRERERIRRQRDMWEGL